MKRMIALGVTTIALEQVLPEVPRLGAHRRRQLPAERHASPGLVEHVQLDPLPVAHEQLIPRRHVQSAERGRRTPERKGDARMVAKAARVPPVGDAIELCWIDAGYSAPSLLDAVSVHQRHRSDRVRQ